MEINLFSDTVTKPSIDMLQCMFNAKVGDDVYRQDPTVIELETSMAQIFGMEAGLFFPSGTMANQVALKLNTRQGDQVIAETDSHICLNQGGGASFNSGISFSLIKGNRGLITAEQVVKALDHKDFFGDPSISLVCIENTANKGGGVCYSLEELQKIKEVCSARNLKFHMDGARIWNAMVAKKQNPKTFGQLFDTMSVCISKGLGAPVGSVLLGDAKTIQQAIKIRKMLGGGMRQAGYMAAAGLYALENNIAKLADDHRRARELAKVLSNTNWIESIEPVETNIIVFQLKANRNEKEVVEKLKQKNITLSSLGEGKLRMVTHLDYREVMHLYVVDTLSKMVL